MKLTLEFQINEATALAVLKQYVWAYVYPTNQNGFCESLSEDETFFTEILERGLVEWGMSATIKEPQVDDEIVNHLTQIVEIWYHSPRN